MRSCIDARSILAFAGGHIPGAINIALRDEFPTWVGWMIDPQKKIYVVVESTRDVEAVSQHLFRIGYDNIEGYLHQGMSSWENAALPLETVGIWTVKTLNEHKDDKDLQIIRRALRRRMGKADMSRTPSISTSRILEENFEKLDKSKTTATYCGSGYRASIAASILKQNGFEKVINIPGSWNAWTAAKLQVKGNCKN